ncbi:DUF1413 domain-containing protein [Marinobacterium lutimaris]|uniref:DUF1413 domain-containing protein n=1 Tax=Marinobacterium lutimaris TaxID=568106 RepID=A0A1H6DD87_9GAMM|nr:DUF1413 domain-containing protein [Marinobacterium lutimaris]SEG82773.1 protein of unknown function [Marinobacterium lutimaris]
MDESLRKKLQNRLHVRDAGEFHFPEIYGPGWEQLWIGDRVKLGHAFLNAVRKGEFPGVTDTGVKRGGGRCYRWSGLNDERNARQDEG